MSKMSYSDPMLTVYVGDAREVMATMEPESVQCVVTSPPYWGLRDYGEAGQIGLEPNPEAYVANLVAVFREVRRVLRKDGTVWLNLGDSYQNAKGQAGGIDPKRPARHHLRPMDVSIPGLKPKDRLLMPARVALALQADGWWLRDEIVWHKPNPMPSSVTDRTTPAHEMAYLLTKKARYTYDAAAIAEAAVGSDDTQNRFGGRLDVGFPGDKPDRKRNGRRQKVPGGWDIEPGAHDTIHRGGRTSATYREATLHGNVSAFTERTRVGLNGRWDDSEANGTAPLTRNKRSVWTIATQPYAEAHFATFPEKLVEPMILAGCPPGGVVLDPFGGSGTVAMVANRLGRRAVHIDLSPEYIEQAIKRIAASRAAGEGPAIDMPVPFAADGLWS